MTDESREKIKEVTDKIVREFNPEKVILFGSHAWGKPTQDSDVDFFIIKDVENTREFASLIDGAIFPRPFPMDVVVYKPEQVAKSESEGDFFIKDILSNGKVLYAR
ncbi:MAG: nucleotidyltransferase domain-containing protein [Parcubacteria group bacterium]